MAYSPQSFAAGVLKGIGAPVTPANVRAVVGWVQAEGGHWHNNARFNPLNTTQPEPGAGNTGAQGNIKVYTSPRQGINATVQTLKNGRYGNILAAFLKGNDPAAVARAIGSSPWGTNGALVARTIGAAHAGTIPQTGSAGTPGVRTTTSTTSLAPGVDQQRRAALAQFVLAGNKADPLALAQNYAKLGQETQTTTRVTTTPGTPGTSASSAPAGKGVVQFDGKPVAAWIAPALAFARQHGWKGTVTSGFRTDAEQKSIYDRGVRPAAVPKAYGGAGSNHEGSRFPLGAVDVSDAQTLSRILQSSKYAHLLIYAGAKDPVHFSHPHSGGY